MGNYFCFGGNIFFVVTLFVILQLTVTLGLVETSCLPYGAQCSPSGSVLCCFNPMATCLNNSRGQMSCLSPFDLTNLSPSLASAPLYQGAANATMRLLNLFPGLSSQLAPPQG